MIHYIGSWTLSCGHGLGTEEASRPLYKALGEPEKYDEIIPSEHFPHTSFNDKLSEILDVTPRLRDVVLSDLSQDKIVVVLGGDHSIALGSVSGTLEYDPNAAVIWFDAHGDVNTEETSPTGNIHGMPVAALFGWCKSALSSVPASYLKPQNVFWVGVRDLDEGERQLAERNRLNMFSTDDVHRLGMKEVMWQVIEKMRHQNVKTLHLSFDIDGMDPGIVSATGTKVPNGLLQADFDDFISCLSESDMRPKVLDFVEYNPFMDNDGQTIEWCKNTLGKLIRLMNI